VEFTVHRGVLLYRDVILSSGIRTGARPSKYFYFKKNVPILIHEQYSQGLALRHLEFLFKALGRLQFRQKVQLRYVICALTGVWQVC
jgi:hypothetical protein